MKKELNIIIKELIEVLNENKLSDVSQDIVFAQACGFLRGEYAGGSKKLKIEEEQPATKKQIELLKKLNKYNEGITKKEAWKIINELKNKGDKE